MAVYILLFISIFAVGILCEKVNLSSRKKILYYFVLLTFLGVQCLRSINVGEDNAAYIEWFNEYCALDKITSLYHPWRDIDLGYSILNIVISRVSSSSQILIASVSLIITCLHISFLQKNSKNFFLSVLLYIGCNFFISSMVSWRQFIAMGIAFWSLTFLLKKKYFVVILLTVFAFLFHNTSIIFSVILFLSYFLSKKPKVAFFILTLGIVSLLFTSQIINILLLVFPELDIYFSGIINGSEVKIGKLRWVFIGIEILILLYTYFNYRPKNRRVNIYCSFIAMAVVVGLLSFNIPYVFRLSYYFDYFLLLLIPELIPNGKRGSIARACVVVCCAALFIYYLSYNPGQTVPYEFFWH